MDKYVALSVPTMWRTTKNREHV